MPREGKIGTRLLVLRWRPCRPVSGTAHGFSQPKNKAEERAITQAEATTGRTLKELFGV